ncbi:Exodeoxyribonuclease 7 large subunit (fragment) [Nostocoides japonicum T1-X7]|uniref:Exodeoxyribonuclease 7 large subunit n=1 Tax=Nostocoides japonicum T1-X7 TaxID=1194083 RepID=A0A077M761_9MICO
MLADPTAYLRSQRESIAALRRSGHRSAATLAARERTRVEHLAAQLRLLSPQSTLDRGYAIVSQVDGTVVRDPAELEVDEVLRVLVAQGDFGVRTLGMPDDGSAVSPV